MAEGGGSTSICRGSDADFEYTCSPCEEDHIRVEAVRYCPVCQEYMCTTCTQHHGKLKATRSHALQDCDASIKVSAVTMVTKCRYHPDRDIEMYCEEHDMVYCTKCIATEHRSCKGVSSLEDLNISSDQQKEIERIKTDTASMQIRLNDTEQETQTNIDSFEEQKDDVISQIEEAERDLVDHIRKLKQEAIHSLETEQTAVKENLDTNISQIRKAKVEIERECNQLQAVNSLDKTQQFVQTKLIQRAVNDAMKMIEENEVKGYPNLRFTEDKELKSFVMISTSLGCVKSVTGSNPSLSSKGFEVSFKKEVNVKLSNDNNACYLSGICQLLDGTIILADYINKRIKRLDVNYNIKDYLDVGDCPTGICCTADNEVAVKLRNNKVQFISVGSSLFKVRDISVTGGGYWGLAHCAGELCVSTGTGLDVYSLSGTLLKTISKDVNDQNIFKSVTCNMVVNEDTVIVTDDSDGAVCLRRDGTVIRELRDGRLANTVSVCVSIDGTIFIAGYTSHNIVMFDDDGKCLGELFDKDGGLKKNPISIFYDQMRNRILVGSYNSSDLDVLNLPD